MLNCKSYGIFPRTIFFGGRNLGIAWKPTGRYLPGYKVKQSETCGHKKNISNQAR